MRICTAVTAVAIGLGGFAVAVDSPKASATAQTSTPAAASAQSAPAPKPCSDNSPSQSKDASKISKDNASIDEKKADKGSSDKSKREANAPGCVSLALNAKPAAPQLAQNTGSQLESVLNSMDKAAASFKEVQATFEWDQFTKLVDETDTQNGKIYFRRMGNNNVEMGARIEKPDAKIVVFSDGVVQIYQPKMDTITKYNAGKNRDEFESFLVLGFGGSGHDLAKNFDVKYDGSETVNGVNAARLILTPKDPKVKSMFTKIVLWIDPAKGVSVQQQFFQPNGDYRLAKYSDITKNQKLPDDAFKIKTTHKTKVITPNG